MQAEEGVLVGWWEPGLGAAGAIQGSWYQSVFVLFDT